MAKLREVHQAMLEAQLEKLEGMQAFVVCLGTQGAPPTSLVRGACWLPTSKALCALTTTRSRAAVLQ